MRKNIIGKCPICEANLKVTELTCSECNTKINGEFTLSRFDYLSQKDQEFALVFLKNAGNIKAIEKELNISYPTVKKNLEEVIKGLGFNVVNVMEERRDTKESIYKALRNHEITFEEAENLLKEIGEND